MIFNINTITYHLYNIQSVHTEKKNDISIQNNEIESVSRLSYKNISIILDEVEIYYHPEMQRELTSILLKALENIKNKDELGIESIHILYLTHSPFILSDIPSSNILRLKNGLPQPLMDQTFGSNVHDLLANDFFLKNGFMGEFAKQKINYLISYLTYHINSEEIDQLETKNSDVVFDFQKKKIDALVAENKYIIEELKINSNEKPEIIKKVIETIGEPVIQFKLNEMYDLVFKSE